MAVVRGTLHRDGRGSGFCGHWQLDVRVWCVRAENQHQGHTAMPTRLASVDRAVNELRGIAMDDRHAHAAMSGFWLMGMGRASATPATPTRPVTNVNPSSHQLVWGLLRHKPGGAAEGLVLRIGGVPATVEPGPRSLVLTTPVCMLPTVIPGYRTTRAQGQGPDPTSPPGVSSVLKRSGHQTVSCRIPRR